MKIPEKSQTRDKHQDTPSSVKTVQKSLDKSVVKGSGPVPTERMIVGEAPGKTEVRQGRPFVGRSGALLDLALEEIGVSRESTYITNVVKFHPKDERGKTRAPTFEECSAGWEELKREFLEVRPRKLLALGKTAQNWTKGSRTVNAWHPSYVLRKGGYGSETYKKWIEQLKEFV